MLLAMTLFWCPTWLVSPTAQFRNDALRHPILVPQVARVCSELDNNLLCTSCGSTDIADINLVVQFFNMAESVGSRYLVRNYGTKIKCDILVGFWLLLGHILLINTCIRQKEVHQKRTTPTFSSLLMVMLYGSAWVRFCVSIIVSHFLTDADEESTHGRTEKQTSRLLAHMSGETPAQEAHTKLRRWQHVGTQTTAAS